MAIGQCWYKGACADESKAVHNIFICPTQDEPLRVLDILLHELIHVAAGPEQGHRGMFRYIALDLGLEGKMTATYVSDDNPLRAKLQLIIEQIGEYPHSSLRKPQKKAANKGKWVRLRSVKDETYTLVISPKSIEEVGYPRDPWNIMMVPK
jgi:hypothetical protein